MTDESVTWALLSGPYIKNLPKGMEMDNSIICFSITFRKKKIPGSMTGYITTVFRKQMCFNKNVTIFFFLQR